MGNTNGSHNKFWINYPKLSSKMDSCGFSIQKTYEHNGTFIGQMKEVNKKEVTLSDIICNNAEYLGDDYVISDLYMTKSQIPALKDYFLQLDDEIASLNLNKNSSDDKMRILCYLYAKLQKEIKYYHPREILGSYHNPPKEKRLGLTSCRTAYGALINHYATCEGIAKTIKLLCDYFDIGCKQVHLRFANVCGHGINQIWFNGQVLYLDLANEIEMACDGRKHNIEKQEITYDYFLVKASKFAYYDGMPRNISEEEFLCRERLYQEVNDLINKQYNGNRNFRRK